ncbi:hypothetical protein H2201_003208 [Coniosporium apollinis]|uniref:Tc1-like transposase DDE domain-containing protein n=1 Tax=Coniosporium apollinis TaxID=61459 RepID=A0ABQ9NXV9_9PEZI|nr:hypothetical protein H2201_003208 [Coniosporium apollinis]
MPPERTQPPQRSKTPAAEELDPKESDRLARIKIQAVIDFNDRHKITYFKSDVFKFFGVSRRKGWELLHGDKYEEKKPKAGRDPRGRPPKVTRDDIAKLEDILANGDIQTSELSWSDLTELAGLTHVHWHTVRSHIHDMDYLKCLGCERAWVSKEHGRRREEWCRITISIRPHWHDWVFVRFAGEMHFGLSAQNKLRIIHEPGTRHCADHDMERETLEKDVKRFHCWAWVGYDFISELVFYEVDSRNGAMTQDIYIDKILKPHVLPAVRAEPRLVLEENGDLGHTGLKTTKFKQENGISCYSHVAKSPDLSIIENAMSEQNLNRIPPSDDETAIAAIRTSWALVTKEWVNNLVMSMPDRLHHCLLTGGQLIGS